MGIRDWLVRQLQGIGSGIYTSDMWRIPPSKSTEDFLRAYGEVGWLFAVTSKIAQSVASSKWRIYTESSDGELDEVKPSHPAHQLLSMVNPFWTALDLFELHQLYMDLAGESFWFLLKDRAGRPRAIWLLPPHRVDVIPSQSLDEFIAGYVFRPARGEPVPLATDEIIHFKLPNPLNVHRGLGPVRASMLDTDTDKFVSQYMRNYFFNNATPGGFIMTKAGYSKEEHDRLIEMFEKRHQGVGAAGRIGVLWGEMDYKSVEISAKELQLVATKQLTRNNILGIYGVPLPVMGITEDVNRANAEAGFYVYMKDVVTPRLTRIAVVLTEFFLPRFGAGLVLQFDNVIPEDKAQKEAGAVTGYLGGILTFNAARLRYGEDEVEGGDFVLLPGIAPVPVPLEEIVGAVAAEDEGADEGADDDVDLDAESDDDDEGGGDVVLGKFKMPGRSLQYLGRMYVKPKRKKRDEDVIEVMDDPVIVEVEETRSLAEQLEKRGEEFHRGIQMQLESVERQWSKEFKDELNSLLEEVIANLEQLTSAPKRDITDILAKWAAHDERMSVILRKTGASGFAKGGEFAASFLKSSFKLRKEEAERWAAANAAQKVAGISKTTRGQLRDVIEEGLSKGQSVQDVAKQVRRVMPGHNAARSRLIARTELQEASQVGSQEQYRADGIERNQWYTALDERVCPICAPLHGQVTLIGEEFPGGYTRPPQTHPQCRCDLLPVIEEAQDDPDDKSPYEEGSAASKKVEHGECSEIELSYTRDGEERKKKSIACGFKGAGITGSFADQMQYSSYSEKLFTSMSELVGERGAMYIVRAANAWANERYGPMRKLARAMYEKKGSAKLITLAKAYKKASRSIMSELLGDRTTVTLYRGMSGGRWEDYVDRKRERGDRTLKMFFKKKQQISSWSISPDVAGDFGDDAYIMEATFKVKDIFASALTMPWNKNYLDEMEVVVHNRAKRIRGRMWQTRKGARGGDDVEIIEERAEEVFDPEEDFEVLEEDIAFASLRKRKKGKGKKDA